MLTLTKLLKEELPLKLLLPVNVLFPLSKGTPDKVVLILLIWVCTFELIEFKYENIVEDNPWIVEELVNGTEVFVPVG